jgi:tRNA(Ile)-lysidine synthase
VNGLIQRVIRTIDRYRMLSAGQKVGVAVSGGADSVCLLHVLLEVGEWPLTVLHLDHGLRGDESRADAEFVRELAARLGLPLELREASLPPGNLEQAGRNARRAFFAEVMQTVDRVAVAHTRSDQAETVLFRFLRGAGTAGLAGIRPVTDEGIVRPLLDVDRAEVLEFLRARGIAWREDSSNASSRFARNRIRHELLPRLAREWNPEIADTLAHTAEWALAEESYWEEEIDRLASAHMTEQGGAVLAATAAFRDLPQAAARRLVRRAIERAKGNLRQVDFRHIEAVLRMASRLRGSGRVQIPGLEVRRSFDCLRFGPPATDCDYRIPAAVPGKLRVPGTYLWISLELLEKPQTSESSCYVYNGETGCLDWGRLSGPLELRNWRAGDRYQPLKSSGEEKIKTLFQKARIPVWARHGWPVLTDGTSIVWARRFGPAAQLAEGPDSRMVLRIRDAESE